MGKVISRIDRAHRVLSEIMIGFVEIDQGANRHRKNSNPDIRYLTSLH
jgi:hypothetical protein